MTLQVALVGSAGWVLASDRRQLDDSGTRIASTRPKLVIEPALGLAFSYAGDALAIKAGYALADALKTRRISTDEPQAFLSGLVSIGNTVWREASRDFKLVGLINPAHTARGLFVCLAKYPAAIFYLEIGRRSLAGWFLDVQVAGDSNNAAKFFIARFYEDLKSSLDGLIFLAAHVITTGARLHPLGVGGGLDIAICKDGIVEPVPEPQIQELEQHSRETDREISKIILNFA